jgi:hypothetical protein
METSDRAAGYAEERRINDAAQSGNYTTAQMFSWRADATAASNRAKATG